MPALRTPPTPHTPIPPSLHRLHLSSHLRFIDSTLPATTLSSHYRALLLDCSATSPSLAPATRLWQLLESVLLRPARAALPSCLPAPRGGFWQLVTGHTLRGDLPAACALVSARLREATDWPTRVASLRLRDGSVDPLAALEHVLEGGEGDAWRGAVMAWAESEELVEEVEVKRVMKILVGDSGVVREVAKDWVEMFVALVVHGRDIREAVNDALVMVTPDGELGEPDWKILKAGVEGDYAGMLELIHRVHGAFFAAHFGDVLLRKGLVDKLIRAHYVKHYCRMLQESGGSWRLSVDYLLRIDETRAIKPVLASVPVTGAGDPTAEKLYLVAMKTGNAGDVCARVAEMCRNDGNFGGCVLWYLRGGLYDRVADVCEGLLKDAERAGAGSTEATQLGYVVAALRQPIPGNSQIEFPHVCAYHDFQECVMKLRDVVEANSGAMENGEDREMAVRNLCITGIELLQGLPRAFWCVIVYDILATIQPGVDGVYMTRSMLTNLLQGLDAPDRGLRKRLVCEGRGVEVEQTLRQARSTLTKLFSSIV